MYWTLSHLYQHQLFRHSAVDVGLKTNRHNAMAASNATACRLPSKLPADLGSHISMMEFLELSPDLRLRSNTIETENVPSSETTTLSGCHDSLSSGRNSMASSRTSNNSTCSQLSSIAKPVKRVRFEETASWTFFDDNEVMPERPEIRKRPELRKRPSFMTRSMDRIMTRKSIPIETDPGVPPAALSAMTENLRQLKRRNSAIDIASVANKTTSRYSTPGRRDSLVITVHQPLRESAGRRYSNAQTPARTPAAPAPKGEWGDLLGTPKPNPLAV